jgi:hypothetical protein
MADEHGDQPTCGKGIAASATLPETIAALARATADVLDNHIRALDPNEANGKAEEAAYRRLVSEHRRIGAELKALAETMRGYRDLPMASHDMDVLGDERSLKAFVALVERQEDLLALLQARTAEYRGMLEAMRES